MACILKISHHKSMEALCWHGNHMANTISHKPFPLYTCSLITIGRLTLEIYFFKIQMDDEDSDDNTYQRGQTITILKPRLMLRII